MTNPTNPISSGKAAGDQPGKHPEPSKSKPNPHKDKPDGKEFGADDDTPQQGGM